MSDVATTLMRVEHKLDMLIRAMQTGIMLPSPLPSLQDSGSDTCPVCEQIYHWVMDIPSESVGRSCGCRPSVVPVKGISSLITPPEKEASHGRQASDSGPAGGGSSNGTPS